MRAKKKAKRAGRQKAKRSPPKAPPPSPFVVEMTELLEFARTDIQRGHLRAAIAAGSIKGGARGAGRDPMAIRFAINLCRKYRDQYRGRRGDAPAYGIHHKSAPGMVVKGTSIRYDENGVAEQYWNKTRMEGAHPDEVTKLPDPKKITKLSTLYDQEGRITQQWVAEKPEDIAREELWRAFAKGLAKGIPAARPQPAPKSTAKDLLVAYPVGDHHMGMLAWKRETSDSYDIDIGKGLLRSATDYLLSASPACDQALIAFLGDFMHYDSFEPVTPTSRHQLDADGRYPKMVSAAIFAMRYMIEAALRRHRRVHVIIEIGNHDLASSIFLMECLRNVYEKEPRITIDTSPKHYHYFRFGKVLIGTHHGHGAKMQELPLIMAADVPKDWGATRHRYIWTGHVHHASKVTQINKGVQKDFQGVEVESFRILPPADAWAHQKGYRSQRDMKSIVLHREFGEVARHTVRPEMLAQRLARGR